MTRPTDWSALGLSSDPTPGDPDQVQDVLNLINDLSSDYTTIIDVLNKINGYAAQDNFVGQTADALRNQMNNRITKFVNSAYEAFSQASTVMTTYSSALTEQQTTADNLLTQAQNSGLPSTDAQIKTWASQATAAGSTLSSAESTAASGIRNLPGPSNPLSAWQEFLQILGWIALLLILPAMVFGGVFALAAFVVNAILFVNALVEFAKGQLSFGGLLLAALGVIAPTTRAMDLGEVLSMIKGIGSTVKSGLVTVKAGLNDFSSFFSTAKIGDVLSLDNLMKLGNFALKAGVWVLEGLKELPSTTFAAAGDFFNKLPDLIVDGGEKVFTSLKSGSFLSLVLPVDAVEVEKLGLGTALKLGFIERGLGITISTGHDANAVTTVSSVVMHVNASNVDNIDKLGGHDNLNIGVPRATNINLPGFSANMKIMTLDAHLDAPNLSMGNLASAFEHGNLDLGNISVHMPASSFRADTMELPDLRNPSELNNIGNGTVIAKFNDMSFVTVHEDFAPKTIDGNMGSLSTPSMHIGTVSPTELHTSGLSTPSMHTPTLGTGSLHTGGMSLPSMHAGGSPTLATGAEHLAGGLHASVPSMHLGELDIRMPSLHSSSLGEMSTRLPDMQMPNLSSIANNKISAAEFSGASLSHTDGGLKLTNDGHLTNTAGLGATPESNAFSHLGAPTISTPHLAESATGAMGHIETTSLGAADHLALGNPALELHPNAPLQTPHLSLSHLSERPHIDLVPQEFRTLEATPEIGLQAGSNGMRTDAFSHLAGPDLQATHLAESTTGSVDHLQTAGTDSFHVETSENLGGLAAGSHANPEIGIQLGDLGLRARPNEAQVSFTETSLDSDLGSLGHGAADLGHTGEAAPLAEHIDTTVPAVSSSSGSGLDDALGHSAGDRGASASPDLAGTPGLIDPNAEKLAVSWTQFKQAQHEYSSALADHKLQFPKADPKTGIGPSGDLKGKVPQTQAQGLAAQKLQITGGALHDAATQLHDLGTNPAELTVREHAAINESLAEQPRALGGSRPGDRPLDVDPDTGLPTALDRQLGPIQRLIITTDGNHEYGEVINVRSGQVEFSGELTELDHGGILLHSLEEGGGFHEYLHDGSLIQQGLSVTNHDGAELGAVTIDHAAVPPLAHFHPAGGGTPVAGMHFAQLDDGGFRITEPQGDRAWSFDAGGGLTHAPMGLTDHFGEHLGDVEIDFAGHAAVSTDPATTHVFNPGGDHGWTYRPHDDGSGDFRLGSTDPADSSWRDFNDDGRLVGQGFGFSHVDGFPMGRVEFDFRGAPGTHTATIIGPDGSRAQHALTGIQPRTFQVTTRDGSVFGIRGVGSDAELIAMRIHTSLPDGTPLNDVSAYFDGGARAGFRAPGVRDATWTYTHDAAHSGFTLTDEGGVHSLEFNGDGELTAHEIQPHEAGTGNPLNPINVDHGHDLADFHAPGLPNQRWAFAHAGQDGHGFTLTSLDNTHTLHFNADSALTMHEIRPRTAGSGDALNAIRVDHGADLADFRAPGFAQRQVMDFAHVGQDGHGFTLSTIDNAHTFHFNGDSELTLHEIRTSDPVSGNALNPVNVDHGNGVANFHAPGMRDQQWRYDPAPRDGGGFTLGTMGDAHTFRFNGDNELVGHDIRPRVAGSGHGLNPINVDHGNNLADFHAPGLPARQWRFAHVGPDGGGFTLTSLDNMHTLHFDGNDELTAHDIQTRDPANGLGLNTITVDHGTGLADFRAPGLPAQRWTFAQVGQDGHGFTLTSLDNVHSLHFTGNNDLALERFNPRDPMTGNAGANFIDTNHFAWVTGGGNHTLVDAAGAPVAGFDVVRTAPGHFLVTDTRVGQSHGSFTEFDGVTGAVRNEHINLQDHSGMSIDVNHTGVGGPNPGLHPLDANGANVTRFTIVRDAPNGQFRLVDTAVPHLGDTRTFSSVGAKVNERISITDAKGRPTGQHYTVDFAGDGGRWTRSNAPAADARLGDSYNASGVVKMKADGTLILEGADKTPFYQRESLTTGGSLELTRLDNGGRRWTSYDQAGNYLDHGVRKFTNEDGGISSWDVGTWGQTIRQYRTAIDGGSVRAEKMPDGNFAWTRFDKDGNKTLSGIRQHSLGGALGWKDTYEVGGRTFEVQRNWSAFNWATHASHYKEFGIGADARAADGFLPKESFKEISQQGKDTGSLEVLTNGNKLEFTRYAEQRPPDFLWKTPENLPNGVSKGLVKMHLGSKYGAIDFPHQGFAFGDSRFQVFKWTEKDGTGATVSDGVRVMTPDGSVSDFAGDGRFVRGTIKMDNGHTIEIGRDANGKWDSFELQPGGGRPSPTLTWRTIGSDKRPVTDPGASGIRTFTGKQWRDTFVDQGNVTRVVRETNAEGDVTHFTDATKPQLDQTFAYPHQVRQNTAGNLDPAITRNTMGQIVERTDHFGQAGPGHLEITAHGDPRTGNWTWRDQNGDTGIRVNGRNTPRDGSWDDSFADFHTDPATGMQAQIHDFRSLDKGTGIKAKFDPTSGQWSSVKVDAKGAELAVPGSRAIRTWKQPDGTFGATPHQFRNPKPTQWRDHDETTGDLVRELTGDNKLREYTDPANGTGAWKEYNFGSVWRERKPLDGNQNLFMEKENFQKQWRVTNAAGTLLRYRGISGRVWEVNSLGKWKLVGTEREDKGLLNDFRGFNRRVREPNRFEYKNIDGEVGEFRGDFYKVAQKSFADVLQDFLIDVTANVIITGATDGWDFKSNQIGAFFAGAAIRSGTKGLYGVLSETALKDFRDGLRNMDGGKDFNRQPYNNDKFWDNEWAGNENPTRWRSGAFDFFVGSTFVPAIGSFLANIATGSTFGFGKDGIVLSGDDLMKAAGVGFGGNLVGGLTMGALKTFGHLSLSGRWFHSGGIPDITLTFGEKLLTDYFTNDFLGTYAPLTAGHEAKILIGLPDASQNQGGTQG